MRWLLPVVLWCGCSLIAQAQAQEEKGQSTSNSAPTSKLAAASKPALTLSFEKPHTLTIHGDQLPGKSIPINYLEAYCRADSTDADWVTHTVIPHTVELLSISDDQTVVRLRDTLKDGVTVEHEVIATNDAVEFRLKAHNPGTKASEAQWAQACIRLADFTGFAATGSNIDDYLPKCFLFLDGKPQKMNEIQPWAKEARYIPGQVWGGPGVPKADLNPRPHSTLIPDNGLIGAWSADDSMIFATASEPWQELFQGVARCLHSDFRIGGLAPGETKMIRGKIYLVPNDMDKLMVRYRRDFPEHFKK